MQTTFNYHHNPISFKVLGNGFPVLMLHGFGEDSNIWNLQVKYLKDYFKLIIPDLPGSGLSTGLPIKEGVLLLEEIAFAIIALMNELGEKRFIILGHSMGGYITLALASLFPEKIAGFGLVHSTAFPDSKEKRESRLKSIDFIEKNGVALFWESAIPGLFGEKFKKEHPESIQQLVNVGNGFSVKNVQAYIWAMLERPDRSATLSNSSVPVLFIIGEEDQAVPAASTLLQVHLPATSFMHVYPQVGHMSMMELPDQLNIDLLAFLQYAHNAELLKPAN